MGLVRIAESLHCALPPIRDSVQRLVSDDSLAQYAGEHHLIHTIHAQVAAGADFLDVNVDDLGAAGRFTFEQTVAALHRVLALVVEHGAGIPPCIDSSDPRLLEAGLRFYYSASRSGDAPGTLRPPLLNSVIASRLDLLALRAELRFSVIAMLLEKVDKDGQPFEHSFTEAAPAEAYWETARYLFLKCREAGFAPGEIFFDPTIGPLGADYVGYTRQTFEGIRRIKDDPELAGSHISIGLSNCSDGLPRRQSLNRAYLRVAQDYGVDAAVLDVTGVTGKERVHPWSLRLVRRVVSPKGGDPAAALEDLADYCAALPRPTTPSVTEPVRNTLAETLATPDGVVYTVELVPSVGDPDELYRFAEQARDSEIIPSITDTAGGARAPSPEMLGVELARVLDRQPIINISCKSEDRDGLIKRLTSLHQHGLRNVFAVTGDYPRDGRAVFDLDSVGLLLATWALKAGLDFPSLLPRRGGALPDLYAGAVASPFKYTEGDVWAQRVKLWKKWRAGASF
ncbi:MAG: hypothetical protein CL878_15360, partial [Dehalococcoidia bacterium]|nr:hypothetical protein [Dehalococcoidia bacterium]